MRRSHMTRRFHERWRRNHTHWESVREIMMVRGYVLGRHGKGSPTLLVQGGAVTRRCVSVDPLERPAHLSTLPTLLLLQLLLLQETRLSFLAMPTSQGSGCTDVFSMSYLWNAPCLPASGHRTTPILIRIRVRFPIPILGHGLVDSGRNQALVKRTPVVPVVSVSWPHPSGIAPPTCHPLWDTPPWGGVEGHIGHVLSPHRGALPVAPVAPCWSL